MAAKLNPDPDDYPGQYRLAGLAAVAGLMIITIGFASSSDAIKTILASAGVGLLIAGFVIVREARRTQQRARQMRDG